jgi:NAD(P) transhydrogenase subunit alpha
LLVWIIERLNRPKQIDISHFFAQLFGDSSKKQENSQPRRIFLEINSALKSWQYQIRSIVLILSLENLMRIGIPAETRPGETRVAATPETVKKLLAAKHQVIVQSGAGIASSVTDEAFVAAGAQISSAAEAFQCDMVLKVRAPDAQERTLMKSGTVVIGMLNPFDADNIAAMAQHGLTAFALEAAPRITRAQSMDVLSSQANIAGYKAVMLAANTYQRFMPMLMTAAGTVKAARVLIMGVGVAGLQAIATAKRLGAVIEASDVRPPVKEQVESLGAKFIDVPYLTDEEKEIAQGTGGYARPMPADWMKRQAELVHERAKLADIIITTALIPGRKAPILIGEETVKAMKPGSVIVDMAVEQGGNCPLSELGKTVVKHGVHIIGEPNLATLVAADASALYARNVLDFLKLIVDKDANLTINRDDEIVAATLLCSGGEVLRK